MDSPVRARAVTNRRLVAITMGDPAGIGPEIVAKLAADRHSLDNDIIIVGDAGAMRRAVRMVGVDLAIQAVATLHGGLSGTPARNTMRVLQVGPALPDDIRYGKVDSRAGAAAYSYVERAIDLALARDVSAIVTAPINKESMAAAGIRYPGHTEILAHRSGTKDFAMMVVNDELRVLLVSIHVSLAEAIRAVTPDGEFRAISLAHTACQAFGVDRPRVAVAGLNPHASENGIFGREDLDIIAPAIARAQREGICASGPWPGDTVFMRARRGDFDIVVAQYHDQGLIPIKYLGVDQGANITVGLPFVRTSVDHGTAFDIAGTGRANHASLAYALKQAVAMSGKLESE